jgi:TM2 domain-containing membrane protein YozV
MSHENNDPASGPSKPLPDAPGEPPQHFPPGAPAGQPHGSAGADPTAHTPQHPGYQHQQPGGYPHAPYQQQVTQHGAYQQPGQNYGQPFGAAPAGQYGYGYTEQKSRLVAGLLGILLGGLGIHRFYLGHVGIGIAQIAVTVVTFGFGALWGFIEGIMILVGAQSFRTDARGVPLKE